MACPESHYSVEQNANSARCPAVVKLALNIPAHTIVVDVVSVSAASGGNAEEALHGDDDDDAVDHNNADGNDDDGGDESYTEDTFAQCI